MAASAGVRKRLTLALRIWFGSGFLLALAGLAYIVRLERQTQSRYFQRSQRTGITTDRELLSRTSSSCLVPRIRASRTNRVRERLNLSANRGIRIAAANPSCLQKSHALTASSERRIARLSKVSPAFIHNFARVSGRVLKVRRERDADRRQPKRQKAVRKER